MSKELDHAFSCAYIELWVDLGSLESTKEARVALGYRLEQLLRFFRFVFLPLYQKKTKEIFVRFHRLGLDCANELLVRFRLSFQKLCKLDQHAEYEENCLGKE